jgi:hypothetical protein
MLQVFRWSSPTTVGDATLVEGDCYYSGRGCCYHPRCLLRGGWRPTSPELGMDLAGARRLSGSKLTDEGMTDGPPTFAYLVFGPGGVSQERLSRPIKAVA